MFFPAVRHSLSLSNMSHGKKRTSDSAQRAWTQFRSDTRSRHNRREFAKLSLAALPVAGWGSVIHRLGAAESPARPPRKPDSEVSGVQLGLNVPYSFADPLMSGDDILKNCLQLGLSAVELRTQPVEAFLGAPAILISPKNSAAPYPKQLP